MVYSEKDGVDCKRKGRVDADGEKRENDKSDVGEARAPLKTMRTEAGGYARTTLAMGASESRVVSSFRAPVGAGRLGRWLSSASRPRVRSSPFPSHLSL